MKIYVYMLNIWRNCFLLVYVYKELKETKLKKRTIVKVMKFWIVHYTTHKPVNNELINQINIHI